MKTICSWGFAIPVKALALMAGMLLTADVAFAGDGTQSNPYTVSELLAQKDALAASGETVWVKANLKGLGEDGSLTENTDGSAAFFGDETGTFTAYSYQIFGELALADLTNTDNLLIALTYGTEGHPYGNSENPQYASNKEPTDPHFSIAEVHGALSLNIADGLRGYHIAASYIVPKDVIAVKVNAGYSSNKGAYVTYTNFDGADTENTHVTPKNAALVLMATPGNHDFVLSAALYEQTISNGNALNSGTQAGINVGTTKNRARYRFVSGEKPGFERNSEENCTVTLLSKDEVFLQVSSMETNFFGNWTWETQDKNWISWEGGKYSDFHNVESLKGDVNGDGVVDVADISAIISQMAGTATYYNADVNDDGTVDVADISTVITIMAS